MKNVSLFLILLCIPTSLIGAASTGKKIFHSVDSQILEIHNIGPTEITGSKVKKAIITGPLSAKNVRFGYISVIGSSYIEGSAANSVRVTGAIHSANSHLSKIEVTGAFKGENTKAENAYVTGYSEMKGSQFTTAAFEGKVKAHNSHFQTISARSDKVSLIDSNVENLTVEDTRSKEQQIVSLAGNTRVKKITFKAGKGLVIIKDKDVNVTKITGGKLEKRLRQQNHQKAVEEKVDENRATEQMSVDSPASMEATTRELDADKDAATE